MVANAVGVLTDMADDSSCVNDVLLVVWSSKWLTWNMDLVSMRAERTSASVETMTQIALTHFVRSVVKVPGVTKWNR